RGNRLGRAIRTERYRLVVWKKFGAKEADDFELYDYRDDPLETKNIAKDNPVIVEELLAKLETHPEAKPPQR
ncbi:MAG TPA: iduronate-2-sulfatase, partial [Planctomycetaceae bacterium]|nr:iduronate-2-sulfatase [Planctomycetaceae bacterium]